MVKKAPLTKVADQVVLLNKAQKQELEEKFVKIVGLEKKLEERDKTIAQQNATMAELEDRLRALSTETSGKDVKEGC